MNNCEECKGSGKILFNFDKKKCLKCNGCGKIATESYYHDLKDQMCSFYKHFNDTTGHECYNSHYDNITIRVPPYELDNPLCLRTIYNKFSKNDDAIIIRIKFFRNYLCDRRTTLSPEENKYEFPYLPIVVLLYECDWRAGVRFYETLKETLFYNLSTCIIDSNCIK